MAETNFSGPVNSEAGLLSGPFTEATAPTDPTTGQLAYFSDLGGSATWAQWDGSAWTAVGGGGSTAILAAPYSTTTIDVTAIGQIITVVNDRSAGSGPYELNATNGLGEGLVIIDGMYIFHSPYTSENAIQLIGSNFPITVPSGNFSLQFVVAGVVEGAALLNLTGMSAGGQIEVL